MIQPHELKLDLPVSLSNGVRSTTTKLWQVLAASKDGNLNAVKSLSADCPELLYGQYNYTPPIHFAVREGHTDLVKYLLTYGAHDPGYKNYPFGESLEMMATDREFDDIHQLLEYYEDDLPVQSFKGDNGEIHYNRTEEEKEFEQAVYKQDVKRASEILDIHPVYIHDQTWFWGEGIMAFAAKEINTEMIDLLSGRGATVPGILKWARYYYFEKPGGAKLMMEKGMNANTMSWQQVTLLHDMAQIGDIPKAELLIKYGASLNEIDDEYQSTPLGMAARWGNEEMVRYLLEQGADPAKGGASWSTPLAWARKKQKPGIEEILKRAGAR